MILLTCEDGDELRCETFFVMRKRFIVLWWWRRNEDGLWARIEGSDGIGFFGIESLEKVIDGLQKMRDQIKGTAG